MRVKHDYLLNKTVKIYQPSGLYHASSDAVWLAASVKDVKKNQTFLDVGSGSGAISLCLASRLKDKLPNITGLDIQQELVDAANISIRLNKFDDITFECINILQNKYKPCSFDHVITNPPYFFENVLSPNYSKATAHNFQEQDFVKWVDFCIKALKPKGRFYMINQASLLEHIIFLLHNRLGAIEILPLFSKPCDKKAKRFIIRAQKDCKTPLSILSPIYIHNEDNTHSQIAQAVLREGQGI